MSHADRLTRREALGKGLAAIALGLGARKGLALQPAMGHRPTGAQIPQGSGAVPLWQSVRFPSIDAESLRRSVLVDGLPFHGWWTGEGFRLGDIPFHRPEIPPPPFTPPAPQESTDVAIVGGGLTGLACAYFLRRQRPVLFELHPHFGGSAQGESFGSTPYSLGSAYFITPDEGSLLERLYHELGVDRTAHESPASDDPSEISGRVYRDLMDAPGLDEPGREAIRQYRALVTSYGEEYPEIPLDAGADNAWILDLDRRSLEESITGALTVPVPRVLHAAIEGYCYSSFNASWREISAASGWNFIAAEEFGRWVLPGGNAGLVQALVAQLLPLESRWNPHRGPGHLRAGCRVVDIRKLDTDHTLVTWRGVDGVLRSLSARRVIVASPKHLVRHMIPDLPRLDPELAEATHLVHTASYLVANVLLEGDWRQGFYDLFLLGDGRFPLQDSDVPGFARITDALNANLSLGRRRRRDDTTVLTLYWPLPYPTSRFDIINDEAWLGHAQSAARQVRSLLALLRIPEARVRQVRLTRWGHSMPIAARGFIASGAPQVFRRAHQGGVYFAHSDNWALPAVETCLLEAQFQAQQVRASL